VRLTSLAAGRDADDVCVSAADAAAASACGDGDEDDS